MNLDEITCSNVTTGINNSWTIDAAKLACNCDGVESAISSSTQWCYTNTTTTDMISDIIKNNKNIATTITDTIYDELSNAAISANWYNIKDNTKSDKNKNINESEKKEMKFNFGPCSNDNVRMSMYGLAVKNKAGTWVSYNDGKIIDVEPFNFDGRKYLYKIPVAFNDIAAGDILIHNGVPVFVSSVEKGIHVIDVYDGCEKDIILTSNMFGFEYATKVVSLFNMTKQAPTAEQPFGNFLPFLMAKEGENIDPMMFMLMSGGKLDMSNPMMMYFLMNHGELDPMMLMFMMNNNK